MYIRICSKCNFKLVLTVHLTCTKVQASRPNAPSASLINDSEDEEYQEFLDWLRNDDLPDDDYSHEASIGESDVSDSDSIQEDSSIALAMETDDEAHEPDSTEEPMQTNNPKEQSKDTFMQTPLNIQHTKSK